MATARGKQKEPVRVQIELHPIQSDTGMWDHTYIPVLSMLNCLFVVLLMNFHNLSPDSYR